MNSVNEEIKYAEITLENIVHATQTEMRIFPDMCGFLSYYNAFKKGAPYYLVRYRGQTAGITGLYEDDRLGEKNTVWLGWYGLLPEFRGLGLGRTVLCDTIAEAKRRGYDTFRLYTSVKRCSAACALYDKVMDAGEDYTLEEPELMRRVYSKSLTDKKVEPWNDRYLYLTENHSEEQEALSRFKKFEEQRR